MKVIIAIIVLICIAGCDFGKKTWIITVGDKEYRAKRVQVVNFGRTVNFVTVDGIRISTNEPCTIVEEKK